MKESMKSNQETVEVEYKRTEWVCKTTL